MFASNNLEKTKKTKFRDPESRDQKRDKKRNKDYSKLRENKRSYE